MTVYAVILLISIFLFFFQQLSEAEERRRLGTRDDTTSSLSGVATSGSLVAPDENNGVSSDTSNQLTSPYGVIMHTCIIRDLNGVGLVVLLI